MPFLRSVHQERSGAAAAAVVFVVSAVISWVGWIPLSLPPRLVGAVVPQGNCIGVPTASLAMYICSAKVAALTVVGPLAVVLLLFLLRAQLTKWLGALIPKLPEETRFLAAPVLATAMFGMVWSGVHFPTAGQTGILPQTIFPGVVGLFTFAVARFGPSLQGSLGSFFDVRDRYPAWMRVAAAILAPLIFSLLITAQERVSDVALKEQLVVLLALATGYLALTPRRGDLLAGVRQMVPGQRPGA